MRALLRVVAVLVVAVLAVVAVVAGRIVLAADDDERRTSDAVVVLGAAQYDGEPQPYLAARLEHALDLFEAGVAPRVVTVGGSLPGDRFSEAEAGKRWLVEHGVPEDAVIAVPVGGNTLASLSAVARLMREEDWQDAVVVTDRWHSLRATEMLEQQGRTAYASPTRSGPSTEGGESALRYVARETLAYLYWLWQRAVT